MDNQAPTSQTNLFIPSFETVSRENLEYDDCEVCRKPNSSFVKNQRRIRSESTDSLSSTGSIFEETSLPKACRNMARKPLFRSDSASFEFTENIERKVKEKTAESNQMIANSLRGHFVFKNLDATQT